MLEAPLLATAQRLITPNQDREGQPQSLPQTRHTHKTAHTRCLIYTKAPYIKLSHPLKHTTQATREACIDRVCVCKQGDHCDMKLQNYGDAPL